MTAQTLKTLMEAGSIRPLDWAFGEFIAGQAQNHATLLGELGALLSYRLGQQDTCLDLQQLDRLAQPFLAPQYDASCRAKLCESGVVFDADTDDTSKPDKPLVLKGDQLYLQRYWHYEQALLTRIISMANEYLVLDGAEVSKWCERVFDPMPGETDWQRVAVCLASRQKLVFVTGGPGTGKTTTVTRLLAIRQGIAVQNGNALNIALVAPTGKAAARLGESIAAAKQRLPEALRAHIPDTCSTVHRLLGTLPGSHQFRFNQANPLHLDMLVVDEVSMVDLPLMSKLFTALPRHAQIILLGDKDQLASVEAGSVLSDLTQAALGEDGQSRFSPEMQHWLRETGNVLYMSEKTARVAVRPLADNLVVLQKSHRFSASSDIGKLAEAINQGDARATLTLLQDPARSTICLTGQSQYDSLINAVLPTLTEAVKAVKNGDLETAFGRLLHQQILCAQRVGDWGVDIINSLAEQALASIGMIDSSAEFYPGRPVMLSQNDHNQRLYNGDIGLVMADPEQPDLLKVWFPLPEGGFRGVIPNRLPAHETLYAMTIHKSQGSEFNQVHLCLPPVRGGQVARGLSRELIYTGLTRARERFTVYAEPGALKQALTQRCVRSSGLSHALHRDFPA